MVNVGPHPLGQLKQVISSDAQVPALVSAIPEHAQNRHEELLVELYEHLRAVNCRATFCRLHPISPDSYGTPSIDHGYPINSVPTRYALGVIHDQTSSIGSLANVHSITSDGLTAAAAVDGDAATSTEETLSMTGSQLSRMSCPLAAPTQRK